MASFLQTIKNSLPIGWTSPIGRYVGAQTGSKNPDKNLENSLIPIPLPRLVQSIGNWRDGVKEAEYYIPFRVKMQQLYNDLIDEPHVAAAMERRCDLTLQRDFKVVSRNGTEYEDVTKWLKEQAWFIDYQRYILTAKFRGFTLISLGDIVSNEQYTNGLPNMQMIEHSVISPDRYNVASVIYSVAGMDWRLPPYDAWHVYVHTTPEFGRQGCGYGLLHKVAVPAILLRNNLTDNANYNEKFGMPVTWGKTAKRDDERQNWFNQLRSMGASATFVTDMEDQLQFLEAKGAGQAYKTYADLESRCQKLISKVFLGHADVLDSIPKKSGSAEGNSATPTTPVQMALDNIASKDAKFVTPYVNQLIKMLRNQGVNLPKDARFEYTNDTEEEETKNRINNKNLVIAQIAKTMKDSNLQMDAAYFTKQTEIPCEKIAPPVQKPPVAPTLPKELDLAPKIKEKLNKLYTPHTH